METIRRLKEEARTTQLELANAVWVTPVLLYDWERGEYEPKSSQVRALPQVSGISMDHIAFEEPVVRKAAA